MPHRTQLSDENTLIVTIYRDGVTAAEIEQGFAAHADLVRDGQRVAAICDFRRCRLDFSAIELRSLAARSAQAAVPGISSKRAILAGDDLTFGMGRMFSAFSGDQPVETRTFRDIGALADWLELDRDAVSAKVGSAD